MTLAEAAEAVLTANWTGGSTVPSRRQYPHQWGWDAAYIAIGWSWLDPARAATELESLLAGQWEDGRVPHIVFHPDVPEDAYFPGPSFWGRPTSGITQPPLHARAALEVAERGAGDDFLRRVFPRLAAQHAYLADAARRGRRRAGGDRAPVGVRARRQPGLGRAAGARSSCPRAASSRTSGRTAATSTPASGRATPPTTASSTSPRAYRDGGYADDGDAAPSSSRTRCSTRSGCGRRTRWPRSPSGSARTPGRSASPPPAIHAALLARLWDGERFRPRDLVAGRLVEPRTILGLGPLLDPDLPAAVRDAVAAELALAALPLRRRDRRRVLRPARRPSSTAAATGAGRCGRTSTGCSRAACAATGSTRRPPSSSARPSAGRALPGMREYFDPVTGDGLGATEFSWTAAVVIDILGA